MLESSFLRRFALPVVLIVCALAASVAGILAATDAASAGAIWSVTIVAIVAMIASIAAGYLFVRHQTREIIQLFHKVLPTREPPPDDRDSAYVLERMAGSFGELMAQAGKDKAQLLTIISSMSDGLIATDHQQRILLTNEAAAELMSFRSNEPMGKQLWEVVPIESILKIVTEASLTGQRKTVSIGPMDGRHLEVTVCRLPLRPAGFVIVAHDVTETMRYEELRKEFVANVSHELRTPLTVIKGYVETLKDGALDDREHAIQYLTTVERHADQLTNLVQDLLSLSRLDSMAAVPNPRPVHLNQVIAKVRELMQPAAQKKGQKLTTHCDGASRAVVGNAEYLERAVTNLVENAIKYTKDGGSIDVFLKMGAKQAIIEVADNGFGIAAEDLPRIFERFYRVDRSRSRDMGGTGLGLSIVKHIVQAHGGTVDVTSTPGLGSTFRINLPLLKEEPAKADAPPGNQ